MIPTSLRINLRQRRRLSVLPFFANVEVENMREEIVTCDGCKSVIPVGAVVLELVIHWSQYSPVPTKLDCCCLDCLRDTAGKFQHVKEKRA